MIFPSIDLINGKAVQLVQGRKKVIERDDVFALANEFRKFGEIQVIDLDAAIGNSNKNNIGLIKEICRFADVRVGGGIRTAERARKLLNSGASKIIIGTNANKEFLSELFNKIPRERIVVALDSEKGKVVTEGWRKQTDKTPVQLAKELENYCSEFLYTCVDKEGKMEGADFETIKKLVNATKNKVTVAGGISSVEEIKKLESLKVNSVLGMAIYTGKLNLPDILISLLQFNENGLIPTVVQDFDSKQVLMLAYSNKDSIQKTLETGKAYYYSRSRNRLWLKGEESGNFQFFEKVAFDCDWDALLFTVKQKNVACHTGSYSCFGGKGVNALFLNELFSVMNERKETYNETSYTCKLFENPGLLNGKLREEIEEVIEAAEKNDKGNLVWEISDVIYFLLAIAASKNISMDSVWRELERRNNI